MSSQDIGTRREVFFDLALVDALTGGASVRLHPPVADEVAFSFDAPWEGETSTYATVLRDGDRLLLYYRGQRGDTGDEVTCLAESRTGRRFERVLADLFRLPGGERNNIIWRARGSHNFAPLLDTTALPGDPLRFKALGGAPLSAFASDDGLHWRSLGDQPVISDGAFDSLNVPVLDPVGYRAFYRDFRDGHRDIKTATSPDFLHWSPGAWLDLGRPGHLHLYTNAVSRYPRAPHLFVGFPMRFVPDRRRILSHVASGVSDGLFMASRDGIAWHLHEAAFLRPGRDDENWTERNQMIAPQVIDNGDGTVSVFWTEHYRHATCRLRRGVLRADGFASVHADWREGELLTAPFRHAGEELRLNFATSAAGELRVALCDESGTPLAGLGFDRFAPLYGDATDERVAWRGGASVAQHAGRPVRLRVRLVDADLYAFRFVESATPVE